MRAKARNTCVDTAIAIKKEVVSEIVDRELVKQEKDPNYISTFTLKNPNRVKECLDQIDQQVWIRDNILIDNGHSMFNIPKKQKRH